METMAFEGGRERETDRLADDRSCCRDANLSWWRRSGPGRVPP